MVNLKMVAARLVLKSISIHMTDRPDRSIALVRTVIIIQPS